MHGIIHIAICSCGPSGIAYGVQEMLPHPAADSGFGSMLFKAQLSTSRLKANLEQEYQATIDFVFKALYEVRCSVCPPILHTAFMVWSTEATLY